jgi:predicted RND superfamily exporter protein
LLDEFRGNQLLSDALLIYKDNIEYLLSLKENYAFLKNPYSEGYRRFFGKRKEFYSLFNTQQIMRKLKSKYHSIDDMVNSLKEERNKTVASMNVMQEAIKNYKKDLGDNQLPNQGFGFSGDGWDGGSDEDDLWHQIRDETDWKIKQEEMERKQADADAEYYDNYDPEEEARIEEEQIEHEIQRLVNENESLKLFEFDEEAYFKHYESISIKEVLKIKQLVVIDDVLLEGKFFSFQEMTDWLGKRLFHFSFT